MVWLSLQPPHTSELLISHDSGTTFIRTSEPDLVSINGCSMNATSNSALWAECPTGMAVSFFYSGNGGLSWNRVPNHQFSGTGGGYFDPVSNSLAYLDYGPNNSSNAKNLFQITKKGLEVRAVGRLPCESVDGLVFTDALHGLAACDTGSTLPSIILERTTNGGVTWRRDSAFSSI